MKSKIVGILKSIARLKCWDDEGEDESIEALAGGNFDDAYEGGYQSGQIMLARDLLEILGKEDSSVIDAEVQHVVVDRDDRNELDDNTWDCVEGGLSKAESDD